VNNVCAVLVPVSTTVPAWNELTPVVVVDENALNVVADTRAATAETASSVKNSFRTSPVRPIQGHCNSQPLRRQADFSP
jgi:hypothetical protein